jgi:hypothetical protein
MNLIKSDFSAIRVRDVILTLLLDLGAVAVVYFTPKICELIQLPFWMVEPMRLMVIISIAHSSPINSYILALTLPLFSWAVSGHPEFFKMLVMTIEITVNVFLFYFLVRKIYAVFLSMVISIVASKILCYTLYLIFSSVVKVDLSSETETSFLIAQMITTLVFSAYIFLILRKKNNNFAE